MESKLSKLLSYSSAVAAESFFSLVSVAFFATLLTSFLCLAKGQSDAEYFSSEPYNKTVYEGETFAYNCTAINPSGQNIATWIIDGFQYYYADLLDSPFFTYNQFDNSLTIHNASKGLDGYSFQCILNRRSSKIGYLNVVAIPSTTVSKVSTTNYTRIDVTSTESDNNTETVSPAAKDTPNTNVPQLTASVISSAVVFIATGVTVIILIKIICYRRNMKTAAVNESEIGDSPFHMANNEVYVENIDMKPNKSYQHRTSFISRSA